MRIFKKNENEKESLPSVHILKKQNKEPDTEKEGIKGHQFPERTKKGSECLQLVHALGIRISEHSTCSTVSLIIAKEKEK